MKSEQKKNGKKKNEQNKNKSLKEKDLNNVSGGNILPEISEEERLRMSLD